MYAYRFKPKMNIGAFMDIMTVLIVVLAFVFGKNVINFINGFFNPNKEQAVVSETGKDLQEQINTIPEPVVDEVRMTGKLNALISELRGLFGVSAKKCIDIIADCTTAEKNWIYKQFGVRVYQHGFLSRKEELDLFGWFDRGFSQREQKDMVPYWQSTRVKYVPVYGERNIL